ncbi:hypothetical protein AVEN_227968-1 [Araneus ventricosus]|uniref:Uncharacterized protein n=1 Tax=Araneus ventricosus TaxID=182803 RepID=A0A4Y2TCC1_ARAVE|nr:hypothetical protein AVEN_227968-1 [Araneus ventricosus]
MFTYGIDASLHGFDVLFYVSPTIQIERELILHARSYPVSVIENSIQPKMPLQCNGLQVINTLRLVAIEQPGPSDSFFSKIDSEGSSTGSICEHR